MNSDQMSSQNFLSLNKTEVLKQQVDLKTKRYFKNRTFKKISRRLRKL